MMAIEAAKQGGKVGGYMVLGLMFADGLVGISQTPQALQVQTENAPECTLGDGE